MTIRTATPHDLDEISQLIFLCSKTFILPHFSAEGVHTYLENHSPEKMAERLAEFDCQVLIDGNRIVGVVGVRPPSHLYYLHVHPDFHGQGLGRKLWEQAKAAALAKQPLTEFTVNASTYAVPFYEKQGFVGGQTEVRRGVSFVPMTLRL